jgi:hypothetical protein
MTSGVVQHGGRHGRVVDPQGVVGQRQGDAAMQQVGMGALDRPDVESEAPGQVKQLRRRAFLAASCSQPARRSGAESAIPKRRARTVAVATTPSVWAKRPAESWRAAQARAAASSGESSSGSGGIIMKASGGYQVASGRG